MTDRPGPSPDNEPRPEQADRQVVASGLVAVLSKDLFFGMRIRTSLRQLGYVVAIAQDAPTFSRHLENGDQQACLGIVDFNHAMDWEALGDVMSPGVPILAFGPHKDVDGFRAARKAGVTRVVANGEFSRSLPDLALRYARKQE